MSRAAIVATIVTSILAFSSPSLAASDEELDHLGDKMAGAFKCSAYAADTRDLKEQQRSFQIGLKAARDFVDGMKSLNNSPLSKLQTYMPGATTDFVVGQMWAEQSKQATDEIRSGLSPGHWGDADARKVEAERAYRQSNCSLIQ
jgi:hypothetical protein